MKKTLREVVLLTEEMTGCLSGSKPKLIPLGIERLDHVFGGLSGSTICVLGALDGTGKSTLSLYMAFNRAKESLRSAIISTQDPADVIGSRFLSYITGINGLHVRKGDLSEFDRARLIRAAGTLEENEHIQTFFPSTQYKSVLSDAKEAAEEGCDLIFIDYLQNIHDCESREDRRNEIDRMMAGFRDVADDYGVAIMMLSQMRRLPADVSRSYNRTDLKESGTIGEQARLVLIAEKDETDRALIHVTVDKSSWGGDQSVASFRRATNGMLVPI